MAQAREGALHFDDAADHIKIADNAPLRVYNYTVELWIKSYGVPGGSYQPLFFRVNSQHHQIALVNQRVQHRWLKGSNYESQDAPENSLEWNTWQHIAVTNNGQVARIYINGELKQENTVTGTFTVTPSDICINNDHGANVWGFMGYMTEVRLWNKARSADEIKAKMSCRLEGDEDGLAGYWPLNEITNNTATDATEHENHGKVYGPRFDEQLPPIGTTAKSASAKGKQFVLSCDGSGDYVTIENAVVSTDRITCSFWAKSNTPTWSSTYLINKGSSFYLFGSGSKCLYMAIYNGSSWVNTPSTYPTTDIDITKWHHYTGTYDGGSLRLYVDGVQVSSLIANGVTINKVAETLYISHPSYSLNGKITEVQIWNKALTADEIKANMTHRLTGKEEGLVGYWPLDKGHGDTATDETPNKKHGQIVGAMWDEQLPMSVVPPVPPVPLVTKVEISKLSVETQTEDKADQYVEITNSGTGPADLSGYKLTSSVKGQTYIFPVGIKLDAGKSIRVYSNKYEAASGGFMFFNTRIWRNQGDKATLLDAAGKEVSSKAIGDKA